MWMYVGKRWRKNTLQGRIWIQFLKLDMINKKAWYYLFNEKKHVYRVLRDKVTVIWLLCLHLKKLQHGQHNHNQGTNITDPEIQTIHFTSEGNESCRGTNFLKTQYEWGARAEIPRWNSWFHYVIM